MTSGCNTILYPVEDMEIATRLYGTLLGAEPTANYPDYVGFSVNGQEIGLIPLAWGGGDVGPLAYWDVDDIKQTEAALIAAGATSDQPAQDVGGGKLIAKLKDANGNFIGLSQNS